MGYIYFDPGETEQQTPSLDTNSQAIANANAAASAFLNFQAKIDLVMSQVDRRSIDEADALYRGFMTLRSDFMLLKSRLDRLDGAMGADNPNFRTPEHTAPNGASLSE